jgi:hypothetical protein
MMCFANTLEDTGQIVETTAECPAPSNQEAAVLIVLTDGKAEVWPVTVAQKAAL